MADLALYYNGYKRQGLAQVHIVRPTPVRWTVSSWRTSPQAWCGVFATDAVNSPKVPVDPAKPLEPGLSWCATCLGRAAKHAGLLDQLAALLIAASLKEESSVG